MSTFTFDAWKDMDEAQLKQRCRELSRTVYRMRAALNAISDIAGDPATDAIALIAKQGLEKPIESQ